MIKVHQHDAGKTENAADGLVIAQLVILIDEVRQQDAEEGSGSVHNRALHAGGKRQAHVEENVLDRRLRNAQYRQLPALTRI